MFGERLLPYMVKPLHVSIILIFVKSKISQAIIWFIFDGIDLTKIIITETCTLHIILTGNKRNDLQNTFSQITTICFLITGY